jgi:hypothetical protein
VFWFFFLVIVLVKVYKKIVFFCKIEFVIKTRCCKECTFCRGALHSSANTSFGFKVLKIEVRIRFDGALDLCKYSIF